MGLNAGFFAFTAFVSALIWIADQPTAAHWQTVMAGIGGISLGMGWKGRLPLAVGVATLVYLPTEWLMQALTHQGPDLAAGEALFRMVILVVLAANAAGVGATLRRFLRPS